MFSNYAQFLKWKGYNSWMLHICNSVAFSCICILRQADASLILGLLINSLNELHEHTLWYNIFSYLASLKNVWIRIGIATNCIDKPKDLNSKNTFKILHLVLKFWV